MGLTPCFLPLPYIFYLIGDRYQVIPDHEYKCRINKILKCARINGRILGAGCNADLHKQPFGCKVY